MTNRLFRIISVGWLLAGGAVYAQAPARAFDVASIKSAPPLNPAAIAAGKIHIGMRVDGSQVDIGFMSLADLIRVAYNVKAFQITGPDWMSQQRFDVLAKMPEGATSDQVPAMLQTLLAERFKLEVRKESKEHSNEREPWFNIVFCDQCGHVYGVYSKVIINPQRVVI